MNKGSSLHICGVDLLLWIRLAIILCMAVAVVLPAAAQTACPFCLAEQPAEAYFCSGCGRLFRIRDLDARHRFWGDAFYVLHLPTSTSRPELAAEVSDAGLVRETASFGLGDRYDYGPGKKGIEISARVVGVQSKEVKYRATFVDHRDERGRLEARTVSGQLDSKPKRYLHRRIDYLYEGDRIDGVKVKSWTYAKADDQVKRPGQWIRHHLTELRFEYENRLLVRVRTTHTKGVRDLRGNADYAPPETYLEAVESDGGIVTGFSPPEAQPKE